MAKTSTKQRAPACGLGRQSSSKPSPGGKGAERLPQRATAGPEGRPGKELAGTALSEEDLRERRVLVEETPDPGLSYSWSAGVAIGTYLNGLKEGRILGVRCSSCGRIMVPPRMFCEQCFIPLTEFVSVRDHGTVNTFAICYIRTDASRQKTPQIPAVIELDGASPGMGILHLLGEVAPEAVRVGMRVRAVWRPPEERKGDITDILYFKPFEEGADSGPGKAITEPLRRRDE
ncbi:MAG: Zn-ribbon domain-containing OB-fold protein [Thermoplasmata archaeon]